MASRSALFVDLHRRPIEILLHHLLASEDGNDSFFPDDSLLRLIAGQRIETSRCDAMESEMKAGDIRVVGQVAVGCGAHYHGYRGCGW
jgi:hypothetical protein